MVTVKVETVFSVRYALRPKKQLSVFVQRNRAREMVALQLMKLTLALM